MRSDPVSAAEREVAALVNAYRKGQGLHRLRWDAALWRVARAHSEAIASGERPFSHDGIDVRAQDAAMRAPVIDLGENLLSMQPASLHSSGRAVMRWLASPGHRHTLEGCYNRTAVGVAIDSAGTYYYTQLFALRPGESGPEHCTQVPAAAGHSEGSSGRPVRN